ADAAAEPEPAGRIEQIVASVIAETKRQGSDEEPARLLDSGAVKGALLVRAEQLRAVSPGPLLLPDEVALALDITGQRDGPRFIGIELLMPGRGLEVEDLIAAHEIVA